MNLLKKRSPIIDISCDNPTQTVIEDAYSVPEGGFTGIINGFGVSVVPLEDGRFGMAISGDRMNTENNFLK